MRGGSTVGSMGSHDPLEAMKITLELLVRPLGAAHHVVDEMLKKKEAVGALIASSNFERELAAFGLDQATSKMPKQIHEIKDFLLTAKRNDARNVKIKRTKDAVKFKVRCSKYLYTLCVFDFEKADKLKQSLPPGPLNKDFGVAGCAILPRLDEMTICMPAATTVSTSAALVDVVLTAEDFVYDLFFYAVGEKNGARCNARLEDGMAATTVGVVEAMLFPTSFSVQSFTIRYFFGEKNRTVSFGGNSLLWKLA
ncbi:hypothetical protein DVH24_038776 [Malus domestica]|uniref:60S ribosomal protein L38 n=1 Tax=Malus domestica TaxID=3750 RepID=A0A498KFY5_MALDO|nr:hypothetical protein DVH24_038776 [Malus domestica]